MSFEQIEQLLKNHMGLTSESVGSSSIMRAAKQRMRMNDMTDVVAYHQKLMLSAKELELLIEEAIIPETWFFRDYQPFIALQDYLKENWHHKGILKILSLPCSTGEEPYSIAMALMQAGLKREQFIIDAIDISHHNVNQAKKAVYGRNSFRGDKLGFRDEFFKEQDGKYLLSEGIRACVRFSQGNVLDPVFRPFESEYHLIFCRNLLIYFDRETQANVIKRFHRLLTKQGVLFVGHAEMAVVPNDLFSAAKYNKAFAFRKADAEITVKREQSTSKRFDNNRRKKVCQKPLVERRQNKSVNQAQQAENHSLPYDEKLDKVESLANSGLLSEAAELCKKFILHHSQEVRGHFLLGIIEEAAGEKEAAVNQFKKVTYLDPNHHEALIHLASLSEQKGDVTSAQAYKHRADRVKARSEKMLGDEA